MQLIKQEIKGALGQSVVYQLNNPRIDQNRNRFHWDAFRFYTPEGKQTDENGHKYFDVTADSIPVERDDSLDKILIVIATQDRGIEVLEILEGAEMETITIGLEGDTIVSAYIPTNSEKEIVIQYKEVTNG